MLLFDEYANAGYDAVRSRKSMNDAPPTSPVDFVKSGFNLDHEYTYMSGE
jgi:hypothetical protein